METKNKHSGGKRGIALPFGIKLAAIVGLIILGSIWIITTLVDLMVSSEFVRTARDSNSATNNRAAAGVEERFYNIRSEAMSLLDLNAAFGDTLMVNQVRNIFFERYPNIAAVIIPGAQEIINQSFLANNEIPPDALSAWLEKETNAVDRAKSNEPVIKNVSPAVGINLLALFYPWQHSGLEEAAVVFFSPQNLLEITGASSSTTIIINEEGDILIHPDFTQVQNGANIASNPLVEALLKSQDNDVSISFAVGGERYVGAGRRISIGAAAVLSTMEYSVINEQIIAVTRRNLLLSVTIMFLTIFVTWFFSKTITTPLNKFMAAAGQIESGNFAVDLNTKSKDELGALARRLITMGEGLNKWEKTKILVGRFNRREISDKANAGEIQLAGEYRKAVILSADFTACKDLYGNLAAPEALELLNFFMVQMSECVEKTGGVVDRIFGSTLIAMWGVPLASAGISADIENCLQSAMSMRTLLWELNTERESEGKIPLRMNCGVQAGDILAGCIGRPTFREYSVSGEAIDEAIKCGGLSEPAKTDIVITENVRDLAGGRILAEKVTLPKSLKSNKKYFGFVNFTPANGEEKQRWPLTLNDVRDSLGKRKNTPKQAEPKPAEPEPAEQAAEQAAASEPASVLEPINNPEPVNDSGHTHDAEPANNAELVNDAGTESAADKAEKTE